MTAASAATAARARGGGNRRAHESFTLSRTVDLAKRLLNYDTSRDSQESDSSGLLLVHNGWLCTVKAQKYTLAATLVGCLVLMIGLIESKCEGGQSDAKYGCDIKYPSYIGLYGVFMLIADMVMFHFYRININHFLSCVERENESNRKTVSKIKYALLRDGKWTIFCLMITLVDTTIGSFWSSFNNLVFVLTDCVLLTLANVMMFSN